jgi:hypothetical protein
MSTYFVTGLPRSRTGWLANLLTYGPSFCLHDAIQFGGPSDIGLELQNLSVNFQHVGDSDSGLVMIASEMCELFPLAKWVFVHRNYDDALNSFCKYFTGRAYNGGPVVEPGDAVDAFEVLRVNLDDALKMIPSSRRLDVEFDALESDLCCREIWEWCVPDVGFCQRRWKMLHAMQINPIPEKIDARKLMEVCA